MSTKQGVVIVFVLIVACCGIMWALEDFRQAKMIGDFRAELAKLPTFLEPRIDPGPAA